VVHVVDLADCLNFKGGIDLRDFDGLFHPGVVEDLLDSHSLSEVDSEDALDEVSGFFGDCVRKLVVSREDLLV